jgi:hypothetical protein
MFPGTITNPSRWITIDGVEVKDFNGVHEAGLKPELENNRFDEHELGELVFEKEPGIAE